MTSRLKTIKKRASATLILPHSTIHLDTEAISCDSYLQALLTVRGRNKNQFNFCSCTDQTKINLMHLILKNSTHLHCSLLNVFVARKSRQSGSLQHFWQRAALESSNIPQCLGPSRMSRKKFVATVEMVIAIVGPRGKRGKKPQGGVACNSWSS